jgi:hypothetical protein
MIHMVFAIMFFQYSVRNLEDSSQQAYLNAQSNLHYHYALGMFYDLSCSHTLEDAQAMTLVCSHLRNFPKPGASWILARVVVTFAMELGLHRSVKRWGPDSDVSPYDQEIRKRIFWSILVISITLSGKLGRPMPFRLEDFDIEIPEPMDDEVMAELEMPLAQRSGKCIHTIGLQAFKVYALFLGMFSTVYTVQRSPDTYMEAVHTLEAKIKEWRDGLPIELVTSSASNGQEARVFALYAELWGLEFRMLLRHPAVSMTQDVAFNTESMRICVECAGQMLVAAKQLQTFKSLDTTWYNSAVFVMAITTTLFAQWEKRNETTASDLAALRVEMDEWLNIMGDIGALLGMSFPFPMTISTRTNITRLWAPPPRSRPRCHRWYNRSLEPQPSKQSSSRALQIPLPPPTIPKHQRRPFHHGHRRNTHSPKSQHIPSTLSLQFPHPIPRQRTRLPNNYKCLPHTRPTRACPPIHTLSCCNAVLPRPAGFVRSTVPTTRTRIRLHTRHERQRRGAPSRRLRSTGIAGTRRMASAIKRPTEHRNWERRWRDER